MIPYQVIFDRLNRAGIRYLVAGGVAVLLHGIDRFTADLDLILHLEESNILAFDEVMTQMGLIPKVPVSGKEFAKKENREKWQREKGMIVFSYVDPNNPLLLIDIFINEPKPFAELFGRCYKAQAFGIMIPAVGIDDLLDLKQAANRDKDQSDIALLRSISLKNKNDRST